MPMMYRAPIGTRPIEFWISGRGGERVLSLTVPANWSDDEIKEELEEWRSQYVRYGWNDEKDKGNRN